MPAHLCRSNVRHTYYRYDGLFKVTHCSAPKLPGQDYFFFIQMSSLNIDGINGADGCLPYFETNHIPVRPSILDTAGAEGRMTKSRFQAVFCKAKQESETPNDLICVLSSLQKKFGIFISSSREKSPIVTMDSCSRGVSFPPALPSAGMCTFDGTKEPPAASQRNMIKHEMNALSELRATQPDPNYSEYISWEEEPCSGRREKERKGLEIGEDPSSENWEVDRRRHTLDVSQEQPQFPCNSEVRIAGRREKDRPTRVGRGRKILIGATIIPNEARRKYLCSLLEAKTKPKPKYQYLIPIGASIIPNEDRRRYFVSGLRSKHYQNTRPRSKS